MHKQAQIPTSSLKAWSKNPKSVKREDFDRLKKQLLRFGFFKPLIVSKVSLPKIDIQENTILGGNTRFFAALDLIKEGNKEFEQVWVSYVEPKNEDEAIEYALADNDEVGFYVDDLLLDLVHESDIDLADYKVNLSTGINLQDLLDSVSPTLDLDTPAPAHDDQKAKEKRCPNCGYDLNKSE